MPNIVFLSRDYQADFFPYLTSTKYTALHVTLTIDEKKRVEKKGGKVIGCLEDEYERCFEKKIEFPYLKFSIASDRFLHGFNYIERLEIIKKVAFFFSKILEEYQPIAVVNEPIAIEISEILWLEANVRNVRYLALSSFYQPNTFYFQPSPLLSTSFKEVIDKLQPNQNSTILSNKYIDKIVEGSRPTYVTNLSTRTSLKRLVGILAGIFFEWKKILKYNKVNRKLIYQECIGYYKGLLSAYAQSLINHSGYYDDLRLFENDGPELLFYPLHYEPECVISYGSYFNSEQHVFAENILKCLREDQILVIKEHPQQPGVLMKRKYKYLRKKWANLLFVAAEIPSFDLLRNSTAVITLGGTVGFEALALGKPVINFGNVYFDTFKGVLNITSFRDLYDFFRNHEPYPLHEDIRNFTAKIFSILKTGDPFPGENLYLDSNIKNIVHAIEEELCL